MAVYIGPRPKVLESPDSLDGDKTFQNTGGLMSSGAGLFSHLLEEMAHIIQTNDEGQLRCLRIEFALPAGR
jgi:hypothetical protein